MVAAKDYERARWRGANLLANTPLVYRQALFAFFAFLLVLRIIDHVPWRDEARAWLIALNATSPLDLLTIPGEGHPPLWYLALYPFTRLSPDLWMLKVPTAAFALATLALIWWRTKLNPLEKTFLSFSVYISFQYAVIGRSYVLGTFLLLGFATLADRPLKRPLLAGALLGLAALTHVYLALAAAFIAAVVLYDDVRGSRDFVAEFKFAAVLGLFLLASALSIMGDVKPGLSWALAPEPRATSVVILSAIAQFTRAFSFGLPNVWAMHLLVILLLCVCFFKAKAEGLAVLVGGGVLSLLQELMFGGGRRHGGVIFLLFVVLYILRLDRANRTAAAFLLAFSCFGGLDQLQRGLRAPYSASAEAATLIQAAGAEHMAWTEYPPRKAQAVFAFLKRPYYSLLCECTPTPVPGPGGSFPIEHLSENVTRFVARSRPGRTFIIVSAPSEQDARRRLTPELSLREIGRTRKAQQKDESFVLFEILDAK